MQHVWSLICSNTVIDIRTNNVSMFNILERFVFTISDEDIEQLKIHFEGKFLVPINAEFVTMWIREDFQKPETSMGRLIIITPNNNEHVLYEHETDLTISPRRRHIHTIRGLPFDGNGIYNLVVQTQHDGEWTIVANIPLEVIHNLPEENE